MDKCTVLFHKFKFFFHAGTDSDLFNIFRCDNFWCVADYCRMRHFFAEVFLSQIRVRIKMNYRKVFIKFWNSFNFRQCDKMFAADAENFFAVFINIFYVLFNNFKRFISVSEREFKITRIVEVNIFKVFVKVWRILFKPPACKPYLLGGKSWTRPVRHRSVKRKPEHDYIRWSVIRSLSHPVSV